MRARLSLLVLALAQLVIALDYNIVYVALPEIGAGLGFPPHDLQWVVSAYVVTTGGFLLLGGRTADLLGRRRTFVAAALVYAGSSLVGGLSQSAGVLIAVRAAQGVGGSLLFPATLALINTIYEEGPHRNRALAVWGAAGAGGLCFGSLLGGVLVEAFGWPSVFFVNVPIAAALAWAGGRLFPADGPPTGTRRYDVTGALAATGGITLLVFLLVNAPEAGWDSPSALLCAALAVGLLTIFALVETRVPDPLVPARLFAHRGLLTAMAVTALYSATFSSLPYFLTLYFQNVRGYGAFATGLAFLVPAVVTALGTQAGERAVARVGVRRMLVGGMALGAAGAAALGLALTGDGSYVLLLPGIVLLGLGQGAAWTGMWIVAASGIAAEDQGVASGMASTTLQVGGAVGLGLLVALSSGVGHGPTDDALLTGIRAAVFAIAVGLGCGVLLTLIPRKAATAAA
ncbi:MFS transporter [Streptomyces griseoaurantiacus]|uniref:MFS transporter n=1 Tax=Streptomyces griseoaurantiacus TaxID=68213 RepID=A0A7W2DX32_9ACTN|nr:MFS transporter [Streptomyces griseoaurantiacus]MBA5224625.1 MFS transporter [Streptomyces griseoaurantiacus]GHE74515.1 MFS transporter [Streptomyces griseoaurantiacus]